LEDRLQLVAAAVAVGERRELLRQLRPSDRLAEELPELLLRAGDDDPAVPGREVLERHDRRVRRVAAPRRDVAAGGSPGADVAELGERGAEQRDVAVAADAVSSRPPEAGEH